jgi:hypothetical protein
MSGFKGSMRRIVGELEAMRSDAKMCRDVTLRQYLADNKLNGGRGHLTPDHLFADLGVNPDVTTARELLANDDTKWLVYEFAREGVRSGMGISAREELKALRNALRSMAITGQHGGGTRWISPEVFLDPVQRGAIQAAFYNDLIIDEINIGNTKVTMPRIELSMRS